MLNNPGNNLVLSEDFLPMVGRLDECLGYLGEHVSRVIRLLGSSSREF
jgi:hypothetical protein